MGPLWIRRCAVYRDRDARLHRIDETADHLADPDEHRDRLLLRPALARLARSSTSAASLLHTILGTGLIASGTAALNQWYEREADRKMHRTADRPLPSGRLSAGRALAFGIALSVAGFVELWLGVNLLSGLIGAFTLASYLFLYTPMKQRTWWSTTVGAIPGRHAADDRLRRRRRRDHRAKRWVLFAILFLWQFPHFYSIAWMYKEDYARAGIRMLPVVEPDGRSTARQIVLYGIALIPVSLVPSMLGMSGRIYFIGALAAGPVVPLFRRARGAGAHPGARAQRPADFGLVPAAHLRSDAPG